MSQPLTTSPSHSALSRNTSSELVEGYGIRFVPLAGDPEDLSRRLNDAGFNFIKLVRELMDHAIEIGADVLRQTEEACHDADLIVHTFTHAVGAHTLAREMNIPDVHFHTFPMFTPTGDYPNIALPDLKLRALNRFTHHASQKISWWTSIFGHGQVRRRAGLPKRKLYFPFDIDPLRTPTPILCAWSPSLLPPSSDWISNVHVTGFFFFELNISYRPPVELIDFLDAGDPPVLVFRLEAWFIVTQKRLIILCAARLNKLVNVVSFFQRGGV